MKLTIKFYGPLADILGREVQYNVPQSVNDIGTLKAYLAAEYPAAANILLTDRLSNIVEDTVVSDSHKLSNADTAEFFPPVSGG